MNFGSVSTLLKTMIQLGEKIPQQVLAYMSLQVINDIDTFWATIHP